MQLMKYSCRAQTRIWCQRAFLLSLLALVGCASESLTPIPRMPTDAEIEQYNALAPHEEQIVCRLESELGSRFKRRVCYRRGYLESMEKQGQAVVDAMRQDGLLDNPLHF